MVTFGHTTVGGPFGSVDRDRQSFPVWRCYIVEGARGVYWQKLQPGGIGLGQEMWMFIEGHWFKECKCIQDGDPFCDSPHGTTEPKTDVDIDSPPGDDGTTPGMRRWERIDHCTEVFKPCGISPETWPFQDDTLPPCGDLARCCFKGKVKVDDDILSDGDMCTPIGGALSGGTGWLPHCEYIIDEWLSRHRPNPRCNMDINCREDPPLPEYNLNIKCNEYVE